MYTDFQYFCVMSWKYKLVSLYMLIRRPFFEMFYANAHNFSDTDADAVTLESVTPESHTRRSVPTSLGRSFSFLC